MPSRPYPKTNLPFLFQHGWGFSGDCWQGWRDLLAAPCVFANRGYWGTPLPLASDEYQPGFVLVTHSLGLHFLSPELIAKAGLLVVISGFAHFHGLHPADGRFTRKHVQKMLLRMQSAPVELLRDFHRDCAYPAGNGGPSSGCPVEVGAMDVALLAKDLLALDQSRLDGERCSAFPQVLLLHGQADRIVRPERAAELAGLIGRGQVRIVDGAGHGLPFTHPGLCLELIRGVFLELGGCPEF